MENGNRNKDIQEKKTFANYKNIDITDIMYLLQGESKKSGISKNFKLL